MKIVIVGNGVAGTTCALTARQRNADCDITLVGQESAYFYSRSALMYAFMNKMQLSDLEPYERDIFTHQKINLENTSMIDFDSSKKTVQLSNGKTVPYDKLVLALGAVPNLFPWAGLESEIQCNTSMSNANSSVVHFVSLQDLKVCEALVPTTSHAVVVGGGLIGIELVECLRHHNIPVTFLIREPHFWPMSLCQEEAQLVVAEMLRHGVDVRLDEEVRLVEKDNVGRVSRITTSKGNTISCEFLGVCVGVKPNIQSVQKMSSVPLMRKGILVDKYLSTSLPDVFACGDCAEIVSDKGSAADGDCYFLGAKNTYQELIWYAAKRHGALVAKNLLGQKTSYEQPLFFNSSKFFDIEYTTVGNVFTDSLTNQSEFIYQSSRRKSLRIVHNGTKVLAFNVLGGRVDHTVLERWIVEERSVEYCLKHLKRAQFDVEFGRVPFENYTRVSLDSMNTINSKIHSNKLSGARS